MQFESIPNQAEQPEQENSTESVETERSAEAENALRERARQILQASDPEAELSSLLAELDRMRGLLVAADARETDARRVAAEAHAESRTDELTGLENRRGMIERIEEHWRILEQESHRSEDPQALTYILIDVDNFKRINDTYGHSAGDQFLRNLANALRARARAGDTLIRFTDEGLEGSVPTADAARQGGDELAVIARTHGAEGAARLATDLKEILTQVCQQPITVQVSGEAGEAVEAVPTTEQDAEPERPPQEMPIEALRVGVSLGICTYDRRAGAYTTSYFADRPEQPGAGEVVPVAPEPTAASFAVQQLLEAADAAMYRAKSESATHEDRVG